MDSKTRTKRSGRKARLEVRLADEPEVNPCPPGQVGGRYKPLSDPELQQIYDTALRILAEIGIGEVPEIVMEQALSKGAQRSPNGRLLYPRDMIEDIIDGAAKTVTLYGRDPAHDFEIGGETVRFGTGGAAVRTLDMDSGLYRDSTLTDLYDFARLVDTLPNVSWFTRCCIATDLPDLFDLDINTVYASMAGTRKPIGTSFTLGENVDPIVQMFDTVLGQPGAFSKRPFCKAHVSPIISPLRYGEDAADVVLAAIPHNIPINAIIAAQAGATAPATPAGMLAQTTAETLAALALVNIFAPGYPVIFSNWPFVVDLRTGSFSGSGGEISVMNAASGQISNWLGLPGGAATSMADAKAVDAQMGSEKALSSLAAGLSGTNMIYESSGMMASLLGASFEAFVVDNEMLAHIYRIIRGIEVNEETLGFDAIKAVIEGDGHFLGSPHTMAAMQRDYFYPTFADRDDPRSWGENGAKDIWTRASDHARLVLSSHYPDYISDDADRKIRDDFNILLPRDRMQAQ